MKKRVKPKTYAVLCIFHIYPLVHIKVFTKPILVFVTPASPPFSLFHPFCATYQYHWAQNCLTA